MVVSSASPPQRSSAERRRVLARLDRCLETLEAAHLSGQRTLDARLCTALARDVPHLRPGMRIVEALDAVFSHQGSVMLGERDRFPLAWPPGRAAVAARALEAASAQLRSA